MACIGAAVSLLHHAELLADECLPQWSEDVGTANEFGTVFDIATLDDGESIAHYIGTGGIHAVGQWSGEAWTPLGDEQLFIVRALAVFDDGHGAALYAAPETAFLDEGTFKGVIRWNGTKWLAVGEGLGDGGAIIEALTVFDDGTGATLYAGGFFLGGPSVGIARLDGHLWTPLTGVTGTLVATRIRAIAAFDDGSGPALYVGGNQLAVNGEPTPIAKWDGTNWSAIPGMPQADNTVIIAMAVHDNGTGPALYVGGFSIPFFSAPPIVSRFDGTDWSIVATPFNGSIQALASFDDGSGDSGGGPALYVGGGFTATITDAGNQPISRIARLNGNAWEQVNTGTNGSVFALQPSLDIMDNTTPALHVAGNFGTAYGVASANFAQWRGCTVPPFILGDLNGDGIVNVSDLLILLAAWGECIDPDNCPGDFNNDGAVNVFDLLILLANWG